MNVTIPESQRQEFECFCADNNIDPETLRGLSVWEGWQAAYLANTTVSLAAPTPPAQEETIPLWMALKMVKVGLSDHSFTVEDHYTLHVLDRVREYARTNKLDENPTPPAPEVEPVASLYVSRFRGHLENTQFEYLGDLPDGTYKLYTHPANDGLRIAAEETVAVFDRQIAGPLPYWIVKALENLRSELNKDKS